MIDFQNVSVVYDGATEPTLQNVSLTIDEGELALVVGSTGSGKSTLLNCVNGLVPHFTGGTLSGSVVADGRNTRDNPPRELADVVGLVRQDPMSGFVTDTVEDELAYTMESLAIAPHVMRRRVEETLDIMGLADLRHRALRTLSGGERQRVAIGSVLTAQPRILILDEPTSALDPQAAEDVLAAIQRLVHDLGLTVMLSEHRLERVIQYADQVLIVGNDGTVAQFLDPAEAMRSSPVRPPIVELGLALKLDPLPLSIRDARRATGIQRQALVESRPAQVDRLEPAQRERTRSEPARKEPGPGTLLKATVRYGDYVAVRNATVTFQAGQISAVMGRNGAGKSTALKLLAGSFSPASGKARVNGVDPTDLKGSDLLSAVAFVPQDPDVLLWAETIVSECSAADTDAGATSGSCSALLEHLLPGLDPDAHPRDLSVGSRLMLVLAIMLTASPSLLILDEPTRGLDYSAKARLGETLRERAGLGTAVVLATHDVEFVASLCDRVVILADGDIVTDDCARSAITSSAAFAPQVAKIMSPVPVLTVDAVMTELELLQVS